MSELRHKETWNCKHANLFIEIVHWGVDSMNNGKGVWNYYVTIPERLVKPEVFAKLWLDDKEERFSEKGLSYITNDYMSQPFADVDWHYGITYYEKCGQVVGYRMVKLGCDYNHLWDEETGHPDILDSVLMDAKQTAEQLAKMYEPSETNLR